MAAILGVAACTPAVEKPPEPVLTIGPEGALGLSKALPFEEKAIAAAFPTLTVLPSTEEAEGARFNTFAVKNGDEIVLTLMPTPDGAKVLSARTRSPLVAGPRGEVIGQSLYVDAQVSDVASCRADMFLGQPAIACAASEDARFWRVFLPGAALAIPQDPTTEETIPPEARLNAVLVEMRWISP
jgi:hypothetical protein